MKKVGLIIVFLVLAFLIGAFYFRNEILNFYLKIYETAESKLQELQETDLADVINQTKKEVLTPSPLFVGGKETNVVLGAEKIIAQTNIQRFNNSLLPLIENQKLNGVALTKAQDMFAKQYFEHVSPTGVGPADLVKSFGYEYIITGENLIMGNFDSEQEAVQLWMDSPGHRANILNERFTEIGVAILKGTYNGQSVWIGVQEFGLPLSACPLANGQLKQQIDLNKNQLEQLALQIEAKREELRHTNKRLPRYNELVQEHNGLAEQYNLLSEETKLLVIEYNSQVDTFNLCVSGN